MDSTFLPNPLQQIDTIHSNIPLKMRAFGDDFARQFSSGSSVPEFELEDPFPHESQVPSSVVVNQAQTNSMRNIPDSGNSFSMIISLDEAEICWGFDDVASPEIDINVIAPNESSRCRQWSENVPRLSLTKVEPQKVRRRREQPKQIVFPVSNTRRYRICHIVGGC